MDEKLKNQLEEHRKKKMSLNAQKVSSHVEPFEVRKIVMQREAKDIRSLMFIVKNMRNTSLGNGLNPIDLKELADALERMRNSIIVRWVLMNMPNSEIAKEFGLSTPRITQIKNDILGKVKL